MWYVDIDALHSHTLDPKSRKKILRISEHTESSSLEPTEAQQQNASSYVSPFTFQSDSAPVLPLLSKKVQGLSLTPRHHTFAVSAAALMIFLFATISWLNYVEPRLAEVVVESSVKTLAAINPSKLYNDLSKDAQALGLVAATEAGISAWTDKSAQGLVVFPEPTNHAAAVSEIKNSFSDEVNVLFDEDGTSGVVMPVFSQGEGGDSYAFVMVPVQKKSQ